MAQFPGAFAEPVVTITAPVLVSDASAFDSLLDSSISTVATRVKDLLSASLDRPLFLQGFAAAAADTVLIHNVFPSASPLSVHLGLDAGAYAEPLSPYIVGKITSINATSDELMGVSLQPLVLVTFFPLDGLYPGLFGRASAGYFNMPSGTYRLNALSGGCSLGYRIKGFRNGAISWDGLTVQTGVDFADSRITVVYKGGSATSYTSLDADGSGPLPAVEAVITVDPEVTADISTTVLTGNLQVSSGVTFFEAFSVFWGAGFSLARGSAWTSVYIDDEIDISGDFAQYVKTPGRLTISGTVSEAQKTIAGGYILTGLQIRAGTLVFSVPAVWKAFSFFGTGIFMGVSL